jgi:hypothetical protein
MIKEAKEGTNYQKVELDKLKEDEICKDVRGKRFSKKKMQTENNSCVDQAYFSSSQRKYDSYFAGETLFGLAH